MEYAVNKGVNRPIEFRGLKAQWIWWLAGGILFLLALFAGMYIAGVNAFVCMGIVGIFGAILFTKIYKLSRENGQYGLMKKLAARRLPEVVKSRTRKIFRKNLPRR
jgi:hypothetical protein